MGMAVDIHSACLSLVATAADCLAAVKPMSLLKVHQVYQVAKHHGVPIIGQGGICSAEDALSSSSPGQPRLALAPRCSTTRLRLRRSTKVDAFLVEQGIANISELVGSLVPTTRNPLWRKRQVILLDGASAFLFDGSLQKDGHLFSNQSITSLQRPLLGLTPRSPRRIVGTHTGFAQ